MIPAVSYQGAKQRIAPQICAILGRPGECPYFFDLCCGSGAIAIEMVNQGHYAPKQITMVDSGPWGLFWNMVGGFNLKLFKDLVAQVPRNPAEVKGFLEGLIQKPSDVYSFLLLQAGSFGGKAVLFDPKNLNLWAPSSFRDYWLPTATSSRRSPVNPMMPMPDSLFERVTALVKGMAGVRGRHTLVENVIPPGDALVYIDPPYVGTTGYGDTLDVMAYVNRIDARCYVSEGKALSEDAVCIAKGRAKGGLSGARKSANEEWLSCFNGGDRAACH